MYDIHCAIAAALVEDGFEAFAFRRTLNGTRENIAIRLADGPYVAVFTAFAEGDILYLGRGSDRRHIASFDLSDPDCFEHLGKYLVTRPEPDESTWETNGI